MLKVFSKEILNLKKDYKTAITLGIISGTLAIVGALRLRSLKKVTYASENDELIVREERLENLIERIGLSMGYTLGGCLSTIFFITTLTAAELATIGIALPITLGLFVAAGAIFWGKSEADWYRLENPQTKKNGQSLSLNKGPGT